MVWQGWHCRGRAVWVAGRALVDDLANLSIALESTAAWQVFFSDWDVLHWQAMTLHTHAAAACISVHLAACSTAWQAFIIELQGNYLCKSPHTSVHRRSQVLEKAAVCEINLLIDIHPRPTTVLCLHLMSLCQCHTLSRKELFSPVHSIRSSECSIFATICITIWMCVATLE